MTFNYTSQRKLIVHFKQALSDEQSSMIAGFLQPGINGSMDLAGKRLVVRYTFPETTIETILSIIDKAADRTSQQPFNRFKNSVLAFMENNERNNLARAGGWHRYIEDIYMRHFDPGLNDRIDIRKQTWRKYQ